tara:strand:+ start:10601 stop:12292 length:1692 start_codon:yes stop_codon:yes gene_type:complete
MQLEKKCYLSCLKAMLVTGMIFTSYSALANAPANYFISASVGKDSNDGLTKDSPWASLSRVQKATLRAGDKVYFKSGDVFNGQLVIDASGTAAAPIHFTSYGQGQLPVIDGAAMKGGSPLAAVLIVDQDHLEISRLNVKNFRTKKRRGVTNRDAFGILVQNTGKRNLRGYNFHDLVVEDVFPIKAKKSFNSTSVTGIRFETAAASDKSRTFNTGDIYIHDNFLSRTARFGIGIRHRASKLKGVSGTAQDYDTNVRIVNNRCEDTGGSCVLINGVWNGLLESNSFIRSGAMVEPNLSVNRGSGAWFFRSKNIVAQRNLSVGSRGHNDSAGMHVDFGNENILVQYNFTFNNEGYGTEILGQNKHVIWRHNISVHDGTRRVDVERPEGGKSKFPGKTVFVSDFSAPKRIQSEGIFIYNNTYVIAANSHPHIELNGRDMHLWNNLFVVDQGGSLGRKLTFGWGSGEGLDMQGNVFSGNISPDFIRSDSDPVEADISFDGAPGQAQTYAVNPAVIKQQNLGISIQHPPFPAAGKGIFSHITAAPEVDIFDNPITPDNAGIGAGRRGNL